MAADVIDLTSDAEEQSPTKLFSAFQPRKHKEAASPVRAAGSHATPGEGRQQRRRQTDSHTGSHSTPTAQAKSLRPAFHGSIPAPRAPAIGNAGIPAPRAPAIGNGSGSAAGKTYRPSSSHAFLPEETLAALGSPGRRLGTQLSAIDRDLQDSVRHSQPQSRERERAAKIGAPQQGPTSAYSSSFRLQTPSRCAESSNGRAIDKLNATVSGAGCSILQRESARGFLDNHRVNQTPNNLAATAAEPKRSDAVRSGPGIAIHGLGEAREKHHDRPARSNVKRPYSQVVEDDVPQTHITKRSRDDEPEPALAEVLRQADAHVARSTAQKQPLNSQQRQPPQERNIILNDVTDVRFERISYSEGPEIQQRKATLSQLPELTPDRPRPQQSSAPFATRYSQGFTAEDDARLKRLKEVDKVKWRDMATYFPGRTSASLQKRYSAKLNSAILPADAESPVAMSILAPASKAAPPPTASKARHHVRPHVAIAPSAQPPKSTPSGPSAGPNKFGERYTTEDDALIRKLKEVDGLKFEDMLQYFPGRTAGSLTVRWYTKIKNAGQPAVGHRSTGLQQSGSRDVLDQPRAKRQKKSAIAATDGFVSWSEVKLMGRGDSTAELDFAENENRNQSSESDALPGQKMTIPMSTSRILRQRENGITSGARSWTSSRCYVPDELKNHIFQDYSLRNFYHGTSGDVVGLAWSATGQHFAAGSIAITDAQSQQYNMSRNLLVGDNKRGELQELSDHHVSRPIINESSNVNSLNSMRRSQDPRLFLTVAATAFSPVPGREHSLFTAGADNMLRHYSVEEFSAEHGSGIERTRHTYAIGHPATVDIIATHSEGFVATACHAASESIRVYECDDQSYRHMFSGSPNHSDPHTLVDIFPSALRWGAHPWQRHFLLAGFSGGEGKQLAGETALWNLATEQREVIVGVTRNVFDVSWNPCPSPTSAAFAVASNSSSINLGRGMRSAIQCFAPTERGLTRVTNWQCPALDINDLVFCPYDENLVAAGATDGKVYIWDKRWVDQHQRPWHTLGHDESLNVLPHDRRREETDTGVRFLSWGTTKTRLYSGSSDGIVKIWDPYRADGHAHVDDISVPRQHRSAIMSGAFSPDYCELLIGTENGRINSFKIGGDMVHRAYPFKLHTAPALKQEEESCWDIACALVQVGKIEYRPCGSMPIVQAVQGRNYDGPFLAPSARVLQQAQEDLQRAQHEQNRMETSLARQGFSPTLNDDLSKAHKRVRECQDTIRDLHDRLDFAETARPAAQAFQKSLAAAEHRRLALEQHEAGRLGGNAPRCTLACAYLPSADAVHDSGRAALRVPGALGEIANRPPARRPAGEESEEDVTCRFCDPTRLGTRSGDAAGGKCLACFFKQLGLSTECSRCAAPARVEVGSGTVPLCEPCNFACFRCSGPTQRSDDAAHITCDACRITWEAGVLGYDVVGLPASEQKTLEPSGNEHGLDEDGVGLGTWERERLASRFEARQHDDDEDL